TDRQRPSLLLSPEREVQARVVPDASRLRHGRSRGGGGTARAGRRFLRRDETRDKRDLHDHARSGRKSLLRRLAGAARDMLRLRNITFSCSDPERLTEFWATLLDYQAAPAGNSWIATDPRGEGTRLLFNQMEKSETIEVPIHIDINVPDREAELNRILQLGGQLVETRSDSIGDFSETWTVMREPAGNGFRVQSATQTPAQ